MPDQSLTPGLYRFRLTFRTALVFVLVLGGGMGWVVRCARVQRDAVAAVERAGGSVRYDWEWKDLHPISNSKPWWPSWLVQSLGPDHFGHVVFVHFTIVGADSRARDSDGKRKG
jgi:hypothetical protein